MIRPVIHNAIEQVAAGRADQIAVVGDAEALTYRGLNRRANAIGAALTAATGLARGGIVGLLLPPGPDLIAAMLGVAKAGGVFMPLDPASPAKWLEAQLAKSDPVTLVAPPGFDCQALAFANPVFTLSASLGEADDLPVVVDGDDPSYVVFTSGSTGTPKAILGTQKGLSHFIHWEVAEVGLGPATQGSLLASPTFDVSLRDIFTPLLAGGTVHVPPESVRADAWRLLDWLDAAGITLMHCVPSLFRALLEQLAADPTPSHRLRRLRHLLFAGEPVYGADVLRWRELMGNGTELLNLYGPSETTLAKAYHRITDLPDDPGRMIPVGRPLPNTALLILREGELCDIGEVGEVHIRTPFMSKGYLRDPALTAEAFIQNPLTPGQPDIVYRTGDFGRYREDRSVEILGRRDGQVKVNGVRIELAEVEQAMMRHPAIRMAVAVAHATEDRQNYLTAYYTAHRELADRDLRLHLAEWLPRPMHPAMFVRMEAFPLNLHGKVNRRALPRPAELLYRRHAYTPPGSPEEAELAAIWGEILQLPKVGVEHAFSELGGDSLKAIRTLARVCRAFRIEIGLPELFPNGTVRNLAALIAERRRAAPAPLTAEAESTSP